MHTEGLNLPIPNLLWVICILCVKDHGWSALYPVCRDDCLRIRNVSALTVTVRGMPETRNGRRGDYGYIS
jgi:hypothetical protein